MMNLDEKVLKQLHAKVKLILLFLFFDHLAAHIFRFCLARYQLVMRVNINIDVNWSRTSRITVYLDFTNVVPSIVDFVLLPATCNRPLTWFYIGFLSSVWSQANLRKFIDYVLSGQSEKVTRLCEKGLDPNFHDLDSGGTQTVSFAVHLVLWSEESESWSFMLLNEA